MVDPGQILEAVMGVKPYRWQLALLDRVVSGEYPGSIQAPTGAGKSSVGAIYVAAMAVHALRGTEPGRAPRRLVFFVDRRNVADQLRAGLDAVAERVSGDPVIGPALRSYGVSGTALQVAVIRGGKRIDDSWSLDPGAVTVLICTQMAVSRVLFSGYGSGRAMRRWHAGLMGCDAWWVVDECHLAPRALSTLDAIVSARGPDAEYPMRVTRLGAMAPRDDDTSFAIDDYIAGCAVASKITAPKLVGISRVEARKDLRGEMADRVFDAIAAGARRVIVFVRSPDTARAVHKALSRSARRGTTEMITINGRVRGWERAQIFETPGFQSFVTGTDPGHPVVIVSTSVLEDGADLDADAMVLDICGGQSLINRLGRLNRRGCSPVSTATVVWSEDCTKPADDDHPTRRTDTATAAALVQITSDGESEWCTTAATVGQFLTEFPETGFEPGTDTAPPTRTELLILSMTTVDTALRDHVPKWVSSSDNHDVKVAWRDALDHLDPADWPEYLRLCPVQPHETSVIKSRDFGTVTDAGPVLVVSSAGIETVESIGSTTDTVVIPSSRGMLTGSGEFAASEPWSDEIRYDVAEWADRELVMSGSDDDSETGPTVRNRYMVMELDTRTGGVLQLWRDRPSSMSGDPITLDTHHLWTMDWATRLVASLRLEPVTGSAVINAGRIHDEGKRASIWQAAAGAIGSAEPLAKSRGAMRSSVLRGYRHEVGTVQRMTTGWVDEPGPNLLVDLVLGHHGYGFPVFPRRAGDPRAAPEQAARIGVYRTGAAGECEDPWVDAYIGAVLHAADVLGSISGITDASGDVSSKTRDPLASITD